MDSYTETSSDELFSESENLPKKTHKCTYENCTASFTKNSKLQYHLRRHTGERPFVCDELNCKKAYLYSFHLRRHKEIHHQKDTKKIKHISCPVEGCLMKLSNNFSLKKHIKRKHDPEREYRFNCEECKQVFYKKRQLLQHSYVHTGVKPFECEVCNERFLSLRDCNRHMRTHKNYLCKCKKSFERWSKLLEHKKSCEINKPNCNICEKTFTRVGSLKKHLATHLNTVETKFTCTYDNCNRSYLYKRNLIFHINKYHKKTETEKLKCPHCDKTLSKQQNLRSHIARFHSGTEIEKKPRKPRKDKGVKKQYTAAVLAGLDLKLPKNVKNAHETEAHATEDKSLITKRKEKIKNICSSSDEENNKNCAKAIS